MKMMMVMVVSFCFGCIVTLLIVVPGEQVSYQNESKWLNPINVEDLEVIDTDELYSLQVRNFVKEHLPVIFDTRKMSLYSPSQVNLFKLIVVPEYEKFIESGLKEDFDRAVKYTELVERS